MDNYNDSIDYTFDSYDSYIYDILPDKNPLNFDGLEESYTTIDKTFNALEEKNENLARQIDEVLPDVALKELGKVGPDKTLEKFVLANTTLQEKMAMLNGTIVEKNSRIYGIKEISGYVVDGDTVKLEDGSRVRIGSIISPSLDTPDAEERLETRQEVLKRHVRFFKELTGNDPKPGDLAKLSRYAAIETFKRLQDPKNYKRRPFDINQDYQEYIDDNGNKIDYKLVRLPILYKDTGKKDKYERKVWQIFAQDSDGFIHSISDEIATDPNLNVGINPFELMNTEYNRERVATASLDAKDLLDLKYDHDGVIGESIDRLQAGFMRLIDSLVLLADLEPEKEVRTELEKIQNDPHSYYDLYGVRRETYMQSERTQVLAGEFINAAWKFQKEGKINEALEAAWKGFDLLSSEMGTLIVESLPQMGLQWTVGAIAAALTGGISTSEKAAKWAYMTASTVAGTTAQTAEDIRNYKLNNNGKDPTAKEVAVMILMNFCAYGLEGWMDYTGFGKISEILKSSIKGTFRKAAGITLTVATHAGLEAAQEVPQEFIQQLFSDCNARDREQFPTIESYMDWAMRRSGGLGKYTTAGMAGGIAGFGMGGSVALAGGIPALANAIMSGDKDNTVTSTLSQLPEHLRNSQAYQDFVNTTSDSNLEPTPQDDYESIKGKFQQHIDAFFALLQTEGYASVQSLHKNVVKAFREYKQFLTDNNKFTPEQRKEFNKMLTNFYKALQKENSNSTMGTKSFVEDMVATVAEEATDPYDLRSPNDRSKWTKEGLLQKLKTTREFLIDFLTNDNPDGNMTVEEASKLVDKAIDKASRLNLEVISFAEKNPNATAEDILSARQQIIEDSDPNTIEAYKEILRNGNADPNKVAEAEAFFRRKQENATKRFSTYVEAIEELVDNASKQVTTVSKSYSKLFIGDKSADSTVNVTVNDALNPNSTLHSDINEAYNQAVEDNKTLKELGLISDEDYTENLRKLAEDKGVLDGKIKLFQQSFIQQQSNNKPSSIPTSSSTDNTTDNQSTEGVSSSSDEAIDNQDKHTENTDSNAWYEYYAQEEDTKEDVGLVEAHRQASLLEDIQNTDKEIKKLDKVIQKLTNAYKALKKHDDKKKKVLKKIRDQEKAKKDLETRKQNLQNQYNNTSATPNITKAEINSFIEELNKFKDSITDYEHYGNSVYAQSLIADLLLQLNMSAFNILLKLKGNKYNLRAVKQAILNDPNLEDKQKHSLVNDIIPKVLKYASLNNNPKLDPLTSIVLSLYSSFLGNKDNARKINQRINFINKYLDRMYAIIEQEGTNWIPRMSKHMNKLHERLNELQELINFIQANLAELRVLEENNPNIYVPTELKARLTTLSSKVAGMIRDAKQIIDEYDSKNLNWVPDERVTDPFIPVPDRRNVDTRKGNFFNKRLTKIKETFTETVNKLKDKLIDLGHPDLAAKLDGVDTESTTLISRNMNNLHNAWANVFNANNLKTLENWSNRVVESFNKLFGTLDVTKETDINLLVSMLQTNPALKIFFNLNTDDDGKVTLSLNKVYAPLLASAIYEFFGSEQYNKIFDPLTEDDVEGSFSDGAVGRIAASKAELMQIAHQFGIDTSLVANRLGDLFLQHCNYTVNNNANISDYNDLCAAIGITIIRFLSESPMPTFIGETTIPILVRNNYVNANKRVSINTVQINPLIRKEEIVRTYKVDEANKFLTPYDLKGSYVVFDTETATLNSDKSGKIKAANQTIVTIAAVKYDKNGNEIGRFKLRYLPYSQDKKTGYSILEKFKRKQPDGSIKLFDNPTFKSYQEAVKNGLVEADLAKTIAEFLEFVKDSALVGHNIRAFDAPIVLRMAEELKLDQALVDHFKIQCDEDIIDTLEISKNIREYASSHRQEHIAEELGIKYENTDPNRATENLAHTAEADAVVCGKIFTVFKDAIRTKNPDREFNYTTTGYHLLLSSYRDLVHKYQVIRRPINYGLYDDQNAPKHNPNKLVRNTYGLIDLPPEQLDMLDKLFEVDYTIISSLMFSFLHDEDKNERDRKRIAFLKARGWVDPNSERFQRATDDQKSHMKGVNQNAELELRGIEKACIKVNEGRFLRISRFVARNGRIHMDGEELNPQTFKKLQRFLIQPKANELTFKLSAFSKSNRDNKSEEMTLFTFAVAQIFELLDDYPDSMNISERLRNLRNLLLDLDENQLNELQEAALFLNEEKEEKDKFETDYEDLINEQIIDAIKKFSNNNEAFKDLKDKIENIGQLLALIVFLRKRLDATKENKNKKISTFEAFLPVELDSASSGISIRMGQYAKSNLLNPVKKKNSKTGLIETIQGMGLSVGIITEETEATLEKGNEDIPITQHGVKSKKGRINGNNVATDPYRFSAMNALSDFTNEDGKVTLDKVASTVSNILAYHNTRRNDLARQLVYYTELKNSDKKADELIIENAYLLLSGLNIREGMSSDGISGALRQLFKIPTMTFHYSAGVETITNGLAKDIFVSKFLRSFNNYMLVEESQREEYKNNLTLDKQAQIDFMINIANLYFDGAEDLHAKLRHTRASNLTINNNLNNASLYDVFREYVYTTLTKNMYDHLKRDYRELADFNDQMGIASYYAYKAFELKYNQIIEELKQESISKGNGGKIKLKDYQQKLEELKQYYPTIAPIINDHVSALLFTRKHWNTNLNNSESILNMPYRDANGNNQLETVSTEVPEWISPAQAGKVIGIHNIDSYIAMFVQNQFREMTSIFDAFIPNALNIDKVAKEYNKAFWLLNMTYSLPKAFHDTLKNSLDILFEHWFEEHKDEFIDSKKTSDQIRAEARQAFNREQILDPFEQTVTIEGKRATFETYLAHSAKLVQETEQNKEAAWGHFDDNGKFRRGYISRIQNMDGMDGSSFTNEDMEELCDTYNIKSLIDLKRFYEKIVKGEEPDSNNGVLGTRNPKDIDSLYYKGATEQEKRVIKLNESVDERIKLLEDLAKTDPKYAANSAALDAYVQTIKDIWSTTHKASLKGVSVWFKNDAFFNSGIYNSRLSKITIHTYNPKYQAYSSYQGKALEIMNDMSICECYAHEMTHHQIHFALLYAPNALFRELYTSWVQARETIDRRGGYVLFRPDDYDSLSDTDKAFADTMAQKLYDYLFVMDFNAKDNLDELRGKLSEFAAYTITNPKVAKIMNEAYFKGQKLSFLSRIIKTIKELFNVIFNGKPFYMALAELNALYNGDISLSRVNNNMREDVLRLYRKMSAINSETVKQLTLNDPFKSMDLITDALVSPIKWLDKKVSGGLNELINIDQSRLNKNTLPAWKNGDKLKAALSYTAFGFRCFINPNYRAFLLEFLQTRTGLAQEGFWLSFLREWTEPDSFTKILHKYNATRVDIEKHSKAIEHIIYQSIKASFGRELSKAEKIAVHRVLLKCDVQCLLESNNDNGYTIDEIINLLKDNTALSTAITQQEAIIKKLLKNKSSVIRDGVKKQMFGLSNYLINRTAHFGQLLNADNIAKYASSSTDYDPNLRIAIDRYVTLKALEHKDNTSARNLLVNLDVKGIHSYLTIHKRYVERSYSNIRYDSPVVSEHVIKGYFHPNYDGSGQIKIASSDPATAKKLAKYGYHIMDTINITGKAKNLHLAVYESSFPLPNRIAGGTIAMQGVNDALLQITEDTYPSLNNTINGTTMNFEAYRKALTDSYKDAVDNFYSLTEQEISSAHDLITLNNGNIREVDSFHFHINDKTSVDTLSQVEDGFRTLAYLYGNASRKIESKKHNSSIIKFLERDFRDNAKAYKKDPISGERMYRVGAKGLGTRAYHIKYVQLTNKKLLENGKINPNYDPYIAKIWDKLPIQIRMYAEKNPLYIRSDWKLDLFGVESRSFAQAKILEDSPAVVKKMIVIGEQILKSIAQITRNNIIFKITDVLLQNILANVALSSVTYSNPIKVIHYQLRALRDTHAYLVDEQEYEKLKLKIQLNKGIGITARERQKLQELQAKLERNPLRPLMTAGLFSGITRDLEAINKDDTAWLKKKISNIASLGGVINFDNTPRFLTRTFKEANMSQGTFMFEIMWVATQYSDFVARAAEFYIKTSNPIVNGKAIKKYQYGTSIPTVEYLKYQQNVISELRDKFVNYDLPTSAFEQHMNDLGFMMFSKYRKRIQYVLRHVILEHPVSALLAWFAATHFISIDTPLTEVFPMKLGLSMFRSPYSNFMNAIVPGGIHFARSIIY